MARSIAELASYGSEPGFQFGAVRGVKRLTEHSGHIRFKVGDIGGAGQDRADRWMSHGIFVGRIGDGVHVAVQEPLERIVVGTSPGSVMEYLIDEMERIMLLSYLLGKRSTSTESGHAPLLEALIEGDSERARAIMLEQLSEHQRFVEDAFIRYYDYVNTTTSVL